jgi:hypothetical protein
VEELEDVGEDDEQDGQRQSLEERRHG